MEIRNNQGLTYEQLLKRQKDCYDKMTEAQKNSPVGKFAADVIARLEKEIANKA